MYRVAFNPELPVVAASPFKAAGQDIAAGDPVDWRAMGVTVEMLRDWWRAGLVVHPLDAQAPVSANELEMPGVASAKVAEHVEHREKRARR